MTIAWTHKEDQMICSFFPSWLVKDFLALVPGRSWDSVRNRAHALGVYRRVRAKRVRGSMGVDGFIIVTTPYDITPWPHPNTNEWESLDGRLYDNVSCETLNRECPPNRFPLNGAALAAAGRQRAAMSIGSTAQMCAETF